MSSPQNDWQKIRDLLLPRFQAKYAAMSDFQRQLPAFPLQDPDTMETILLTPNEVIREITHLSDIGKKILAAEAQKLRQLQP